MAAPVPALPGVMDRDQVAATAAAIVDVQSDDGAIAWFVGGHLDPWDHVQAAMGLTVAGCWQDAAAAYRWSRESQRPDGTWAVRYEQGTVTDHATDANFTAYVATGVWHHWRSTADVDFVRSMWPTVRAALDAVVAMQRPDGAVAWLRHADGRLVAEALVTGNASIHLSLRCGLALAAVVGEPQPEWAFAAARLRHALDEHEDAFEPKTRFSMDWYYPVLGGALRADLAHHRLQSRWADFVVEGRGARCVDDQPWVTGGETAELVLALDAAGRADDALRILADVQHLRRSDGTYWTGYQMEQDVFWPDEQTTWTGGTMLLALDAVTRTTAAHGLFRGEGLPLPTTDVVETDEECTCRSVA